jgi:hypothetical protein
MPESAFKGFSEAEVCTMLARRPSEVLPLCCWFGSNIGQISGYNQDASRQIMAYIAKRATEHGRSGNVVVSQIP